MVFVKNKGDYDAYVRSVFAFETGKYTTLDEFQKMVHLNRNDTDWTWEWVEQSVAIPNADGTATTNYFIATATYNNVLESGKLTQISLSQIALDKTATNADVDAFGEIYQVLVKTQAIQTAGFDDPGTALVAGFGTITENSIPWENGNPIKGLDLRTALHYYEGNESNQITNKVTNVVFGLNKDYTDIRESYAGTLVDVEQDVPVYAYYVPNGSNYDVYFLANDKIFTPKNSKELFLKMAELVTVDTHNMDVSRTEDMTDMFYKYSKLEKIDVSHWDTSSVTSMYGTFCNCSALAELDVSQWDVSKVQSFRALFSGAKKLKYLDVSNWDTSSAITMRNMFNNCYEIEQIKGVGNFDTGTVQDMKQMFSMCQELRELDDLTGWDVSQVTDISWMFYKCYKLKELKLNNWDVSKVTTTLCTFELISSVTELDLSGWNTFSLTETEDMFRDNTALKTIYVGDGWDMSHVTKSSLYMFTGCDNLVGGNGSMVGSLIATDVTYACVDTEETPGYLTYKAAEEKTTP